MIFLAGAKNANLDTIFTLQDAALNAVAEPL
jgi:hypothetical protein